MLFENKGHEVYTANKYKIALNRNDDKRLVQADGITTLARGYVAISAQLITIKDVFIIIERFFNTKCVYFVQKP